LKSKLEKCDLKKIIFTIETPSPDYGNLQIILDQIAFLKDLADAIKITYGTGIKFQSKVLF
jgi:hypothetical protein